MHSRKFFENYFLNESDIDKCILNTNSELTDVCKIFWLYLNCSLRK